MIIYQFSLLFSSEIILKQLFASGLVDIVEINNTLNFVLGIIRLYCIQFAFGK